MPSLSDIESTVSELDESAWKKLYLQHARRERKDLLPFPSDDVQVITNNKKGEDTGRGALSILDCVLSCVREVTDLNRDMRVLDYGCGWGRMTRVLPYYFKTNLIVGVDVDERLISSANALLPFIRHEQITSMQALPFDDSAFDIVYANSVFSHLSERSSLFTLGELSRVLAPGGVLVVSVLEKGEMDKYYANADMLAWIQSILGEYDTAIATLAEKGFVWGDTRRWADYGIAIMNDNWLKSSFDQNGIELRATKRREVPGSHHYKLGVKI
ncbi:MAG: class I SAM-dependent methyltransferase [Congregibacter sp.]